MKKLALIALILLLALISGAQPWKAKTKNDLSKKDKVTFFDIQNSINSYYNTGDFKKGYYYKNDKKQKAPGWKQFKRWEWYWDARVNPVTGEFPETSSSKEWEIFEAKTYISKSSSGDWKPLGPNLSDGGYAGIGRINCIAFHPNDTSTYWVGSPSGGLWKTSNDGNTWVTLTDQNTVLGVSDIAVPTDFQTSNTLYIATGDRDGGSVWTLSGGQYYDNHSIGVLKTIDGGNTWQSTGLNFNTNEIKIIGRLLIDTTDNQTLYASVDNGIYKSTNSGDSWTKVLNSGYVSDMEFKPGNSQVIYAASESEVYRSTDGGVNWTNVYSLSSIRIEIAVAPSDPEVVYLLASNSSGGLLGIYKSVNGGSSFTQTFDGTALNSNLLGYYSDGSGGSGGQGSYDLAIEVSPDNSDVVFIGGINTWMSIDGGYNWTINNMWTSYNEYNFDDAPEVHADKHVLKFRDNKALFEGNDGGIYKTNNKGTSWNDKTNGMVISQFYRIGVSQTLGSMVICGLQDNGTKLLYNNAWYDVKGGDGMECIIDPVDGDIQYGTYVDGEIERTLDGWSTYNTTYISDSIDDEDGGWWVTPYILDPNNTETIYVGYNDVWKSTDRGNNFVKISTMNSSQNLRSMAISPANSNVIYVADKTRIWKTVNGGTSWTNITSTLPVSSASITNIHVHYADENIVWVTFGGYNTGRVFQSDNGGTTWTNISVGLPNIPVFSIVQNQKITDVNSLYAGTDLGVFYKNGDDDWVSYSNGLPKVMVTELEIYYDDITPANSRLRAATFGRGLWESDLYTSQGTSVDPVVIEEKGFKIFPNPSNGLITIEINKKYQNGSISIFDLSGKEVYRNKLSGYENQKFDVSNLANGTYIVKLNVDNNELISKLIIK